MKIALLHYSFWPEIGGVEQVMRDQANMLHRAGHQVTVVSGTGLNPDESYAFELLPELAPDFPLNAQVRTVLERGQMDQSFTKYRAVLVELLDRVLSEVELTLVHNVFTMHHNLALTQALHDLAPQHKMVVWTHDLVIANPDYALPNPKQPPWNLMQTRSPHVIYVTTSDLRAEEIYMSLVPVTAPSIVIPNPLDPVRLYSLTSEMGASYDSLDLSARDFIFLLPTQAMPRKNIDFAIETMKHLCDLGADPLLLITGGIVPRSSASTSYGAYLRQSLPEELKPHVVFVSDFFTVHDDTLRDLYLLADCLFFPSAHEGFGLPVIEGAAYRLPIWCRDIPAFQAVIEDGAAYLVNDFSDLPNAMDWLESHPTFRQRRRCRRLFDPSVLYHQYYEPLLASFVPAEPFEG